MSCHGPLLPPRYCKEWQDFFSSRPDVVKENSDCSRPQTLGKKLQPNTQIREEKEKKIQCLQLVAKKAHDHFTDCCKEWHKKNSSKTRCHRRQFIPLQTSNPRKKNTPNQVLKNKEKKSGGKSNSLTLLRRR
jgi:hypothetical protein